MSQALTRYTTLYESLRSRRRRGEVHKGLDGLWSRASTRVKSMKVTRAWLQREAHAVDALGKTVRSMSDAALDDAIQTARESFIRGGARTDDALVRHALSLVREVARRQTGEEPFVVQLMGALALINGRVIEMFTGEGKTLTGSIAAPLIAWRHRRLHVLTVNDYLARRDAESRGTIYRRCLLSVGWIDHQTEQAARPEIYARSIVYGTPKQITADWLRDQLRLGRVGSAWAGRQWMSGWFDAGFSSGLSWGSSPSRGGGGRGGGGGGVTVRADAGPMIPGLQAAMVDEADAVLIDEGIVPLIIAQPRREDDMATVYRQAAAMAAKLDEGPDYTIEYVRRRAELKSRGRHRCERMFVEAQAGSGGTGGAGAIWKAERRAEELVRQALVARHCYLNGRQYQVVDGRVVIVDEYTGRFLPDRSWEHGLHQAVEAKENLAVTADRETLARMSFQRFFRSYPFLCGMTGTAADATGEIEHVYQRAVMRIPTNRPLIRVQMPMRVFTTAEAKWAAVIDSVEQLHLARRPVLVGTRSIAASELIAERLSARGLVHRVLNANFDADEATLITSAGRAGTITVATNMAGRGTDIKPDADAIAAGGLHVILTEMHGAQRIDRQFIGRSGRQGDPGSAQIFVSMQDELIRLHAPGLGAVLSRAAAGAAVELSGPLLALAQRVFRLAQSRWEARDRRGRASVLKQDDWIDKYLPGV